MINLNEFFKSLRIVSGFASVEVRDSQGDLIDIDAIENAMYKFMTQSRSLHFEHSLPIGEILRWERREKDGKDAIWIEAYLYDNEATKEIWQKIQNKEIHGFSIRGIAKNRMNGKITDLELYEISLVFQPANQEAVLVSAFEKSNSGKFIQVLKTRHDKAAFYEMQLNNVWKLFNDITDAIYDQTVNDVITKLETLRSELLKFKDLTDGSFTDNLVAVLNDAINQAKSIDQNDPDIQRKLLSAIMKMVSGRFMDWFVNTKYAVDKMKRPMKL
jgi:hypothetical protein